MIESAEEWLRTTKRKRNRLQLHQHQQNSYYYDPIAPKRPGKRTRRSRIADLSSVSAVPLAAAVEHFPKSDYLPSAESSSPPPTPPPPLQQFSPSFCCDCENKENFSRNIRFSKKKNGRNSSLFCWFLFLIICLCCSAVPFIEAASSTPAQLPKTNKSGICTSLDIRNSAGNLNVLKNCRVIEGFLQIVLMDNTKASDFDGFSFPELREITGYLLFYRVNGLQTLGKLFPNLAVIRGHHLFMNYALCVYEMQHLQELGLHSLVDISRGAVFIVKNPALCYIDTVDWSRIVTADKEINVFTENKQTNACPKCGKFDSSYCATSNTTKQPFCWSENHCQKGCPNCPHDRCTENGTCCHDYCLGGCRESTESSQDMCFACKNMFLEDVGRCVAKCPDKYLKFKDYRCISREACENINKTKDENGRDTYWKPFNETSCILECPLNYQERTFDEGGKTKSRCEPCEGPCRKVCAASKVTSMQTAQRLKGCVVINGSLEIQVKGGNNIVKELDDNLNMIEEITGYLKVVRSLPLVSLSFLRRLRAIHGDRLEMEQYALVVMDNQHLEELWDFKKKGANLTINGRIYFHFNSRLCLNKIAELEKIIGITSTELEVARNSNGDKIACNMTELKVWAANITYNSCNLMWVPYIHFEMRTFMGYSIYIMEAPIKNVSIHDGRDACSGDGWEVIDVEIREGNNAQNNTAGAVMSKTIDTLKPYTQYAYYMKTTTITTEVNGAESKIQYFITQPTVPSKPRQIKATSMSSNSIFIEWQAPESPNGNLNEYVISVIISDLAEVELNYCDKRNDRDKISTPKEEAKKTSATASQDEKCSCHTGEPKVIKNDQQVQGIIEFENKLHDTIYVKNPTRQKRSTSQFIRNEIELDKTGSSTILQFFSADHDSGGTFEPTTATYQSLKNKGSTVTNSGDGEFHVPSNKFNYTVINLKHFSNYKVSIRACHEITPDLAPLYNLCSPDGFAFVRTLPLVSDEADSIDPKTVEIQVLNDTSYHNIIKLKWSEPNVTNGKVVSYEILYQRSNAERQERSNQECINGTQFKKNNNTYTLRINQSGNYSLQLAATSFATYLHEAEPKWTRKFYFFVNFQEPNSGTMLNFVIGAFTALVLCGVLCGIWRCYLVDRGNYFRNMDAKVNPEYFKDIEGYEQWTIPGDKVKIGNLLGIGHFGKVHEGFLTDVADETITTRVAIKTLNKVQNRNKSWLCFANEAAVMRSFDTHHVVRLLGVVWKPETLVVMELMANGDLRTYLRSCRIDRTTEERTLPVREPPTLKKMLRMAAEIADGMLYLADKKFVHRDLAARNCMINEEDTVKIGDFGLTRDIYSQDYYRKNSKGHLPIRWMAPESLLNGIFTTRSDVWSYGVVLWEMATLASLPYPGLGNGEVMPFVIQGNIMSRPENCPSILWELMKVCWKSKYNDRPTFSDILKILLPNLNETFAEVSYYHSVEATKLRASQDGSTVIDNNERPKDADQQESQESNDEKQPLTANNADFNTNAERLDATSTSPSSISLRKLPAVANGYISTFMMNDLKGSTYSR